MVYHGASRPNRPVDKPSLADDTEYFPRDDLFLHHDPIERRIAALGKWTHLVSGYLLVSVSLHQSGLVVLILRAR